MPVLIFNHFLRYVRMCVALCRCRGEIINVPCCCVFFSLRLFSFLPYDKACLIINSVIRAPCSLDTNKFLTFLRVLFYPSTQEQIDFCDQHTNTFTLRQTGKKTLSCCNCSRTRDAYCFFDPIQVCFIQFLFLCSALFFYRFLSLLSLFDSDFIIYGEEK